MSEKQWKQFVQLYGEKNQHLNKQQVLQQAKKPFQQLKKLFKQRGGEGKVLDFTNGELDWDAIEDAMDKHSEYDTVIFKNCQMNDEELKTLCQEGVCFYNNEFIKKLDLSYNYIHDDEDGSMQYLCKVIKDTDFCPDEINLSHNEIEDKGLRSLIGAISKKKNVRLLNLEGHYFGKKALQEAESYAKSNGIIFLK
jgi:hypothetical protein